MACLVAATTLSGLATAALATTANVVVSSLPSSHPSETSGFQEQSPRQVVAPLAKPRGVRGSIFRSPVVIDRHFGVVDYTVDFSSRVPPPNLAPQQEFWGERMVAMPHDDRGAESLRADVGAIGSDTIRGEGLGTLRGVGTGVDEVQQGIEVVRVDGIAIVRFGNNFQILNQGTLLLSITPSAELTAASQDSLLIMARQVVDSASKAVGEARERQDALEVVRLFSDEGSTELVKGADRAFSVAKALMQAAQSSLEAATLQAQDEAMASVFEMTAKSAFVFATKAAEIAKLSITRIDTLLDTLLENYADRAAQEFASLSVQKLRLRDAFVGKVRSLLSELTTLKPVDDEALKAERNLVGRERGVVQTTVNTADRLLSARQSWYGTDRGTVLSLIDKAIEKIEAQQVSEGFAVYQAGYVQGWRDIRSLVEQDQIEGLLGAKVMTGQLQAGARMHLETVVARQKEILGSLDEASGEGARDRASYIASQIRELVSDFEQGIAITGKQDKAARTGFARLIDRQGQLVSWLVDRAVALSGDPFQMKAYYEYLLLAARAYRGAVAEDIELLDLRQAILASGINNAENIGAGLFADYDRRRQLSEWMTLPPEQQGRGVFYDFHQEMGRLGFDPQVIAEMPDRIPLEIRDGASADALLLENSRWGSFVRLYDVGLRNDFLFSRQGDVLASDQAIVLVFHGSGTTNSTVPSVAEWAETMIKDSVGETGRRVTAIGLGLPGHGYVTRDPRFFPVDARAGTEAEQLHRPMQNPEAFLRYIDAILDRYGAYREGEDPKALVLAGRSTGAFMARAHRKIGGNRADLYLPMSAYRGGSDFWVIFDTYMVRHVARPRESVLGFDFFVGLTNALNFVEAMPVSEEEGLPSGETLPRVLNLAGGLDASYPPEIPETIDKQDPVYQAWARRVADWASRYLYKYGRSGDELYSLLLDFADYYAAYLAVHPRRPDGMTPQEFWVQVLRDQEAGAKDFWLQDAQRDPNARLHFDDVAFHNMITLLSRSDPNHAVSVEVRGRVRAAQNEELEAAIEAVRHRGLAAMQADYERDQRRVVGID